MVFSTDPGGRVSSWFMDQSPSSCTYYSRKLKEQTHVFCCFVLVGSARSCSIWYFSARQEKSSFMQHLIGYCVLWIFFIPHRCYLMFMRIYCTELPYQPFLPVYTDQWHPFVGFIPMLFELFGGRSCRFIGGSSVASIFFKYITLYTSFLAIGRGNGRRKKSSEKHTCISFPFQAGTADSRKKEIGFLCTIIHPLTRKATLSAFLWSTLIPKFLFFPFSISFFGLSNTRTLFTIPGTQTHFISCLKDKFLKPLFIDRWMIYARGLGPKRGPNLRGDTFHTL